MTYTKPQLTGFFAVTAIKTSGSNLKTMGSLEPNQFSRTQPAYEADE